MIRMSLNFSCSLSSNLPQSVVGDKLRLTQILGNLLSNSLKFTQKGYVNLQSSLLVEKEEGFNVQLIVSDSGVGIAKEKQKRIFEPFQQEEAGTTKKYGGGQDWALRLPSALFA